MLRSVPLAALGLSALALCWPATGSSAAPADQGPVTPEDIEAPRDRRRAATRRTQAAAGFEVNDGQTADGVDFVARCPGYIAFLRPTDLTVAWGGRPAVDDLAGDAKTTGGVLRVTFEDHGANPRPFRTRPLRAPASTSHP